jgi:hypothetical protein
MHSTTDSKSNHYTRFFSIPHLFKISHEPNLQSPTNTRIVKGHHTCCSTNLSILAMLNFLRFNSDGGPALSLTRKVSHSDAETHCHIAAVGPIALLRGGTCLCWMVRTETQDDLRVDEAHNRNAKHKIKTVMWRTVQSSRFKIPARGPAD